MNQHAEIVASLPAAHRYELVLVAVVKNWLLAADLSPAERVAYLEWLATRDGVITPARVAAVEPANDAFMEVFTDAFRLDPPDSESGAACFSFLTRPDIFAALLKLNPSIVKAYSVMPGHR